MKYLFRQRHVEQLTWLLKFIKGREGTFLGLQTSPLVLFRAGFYYFFLFSFYMCPGLPNGSHVREDSLRSVLVYYRTLLLRQGALPIPPPERPMFIFTKAHPPSTTPSWQPVPFCGGFVHFHLSSSLLSPAALHIVPCALFLAASTLSSHLFLENTLPSPILTSGLQLPAYRNQTCPQGRGQGCEGESISDFIQRNVRNWLVFPKEANGRPRIWSLLDKSLQAPSFTIQILAQRFPNFISSQCLNILVLLFSSSTQVVTFKQLESSCLYGIQQMSLCLSKLKYPVVSPANMLQGASAHSWRTTALVLFCVQHS